MKVRLGRRAVADLEDIRSHLMEHSPAGAERVRTHIAATLDRLAEFPFLGRETDEPGVRVLPLTRYPDLIFYAVLDNTVAVLHIRHAAREPLDPTEL